MRYVASTFQHVKCKWMETGRGGGEREKERVREREMFRTLTAWEIAAAVLADVWNVGTMRARAYATMSRDARAEKTARYVKSFISRNENNIKSGTVHARKRGTVCRISELPFHLSNHPPTLIPLCNAPVSPRWILSEIARWNFKIVQFSIPAFFLFFFFTKREIFATIYPSCARSQW